MAETQHTPGPWAYDDEDGTISAHGGVVAETNHSDYTFTQDAENARLICAAPDMIAALVLAKQMVDEALPKFDWGKICLDANAIRLLNEAPVAIEAAIAKAEGR